MAAGSVFFSLPFAILGTAQAVVVHSLGVLDALLVYSTLGTLAMLTAISAICLAELSRN